MSLRHGSSRRVMTLFSFIDEFSFTDFPLIHGGLTLVPPCM
jgi:hypothetical protein